MRKALFFIIVILALLIIAEVLFTLLIQRSISIHLEERYGLSKRPSVFISSFPLVVNLFRGHLNYLKADIKVNCEVSVQGTGIDDQLPLTVKISARDVRVDISDFLRGDLSVNGIGGIEAETEMYEGDLNNLFLPYDLQLDLEEGEVYMKEMDKGSESYRCELKVEGERRITFSLPEGFTNDLKFMEKMRTLGIGRVWSLDLKGLPPQISLQSTSLKEGKLVVELYISDLQRGYEY